MFMLVSVFTYLLVIRLQYVIEPGDLSQFAQFQLHTLQSTGQLLLLWRVQLLQEGENKLKSEFKRIPNSCFKATECLK